MKRLNAMRAISGSSWGASKTNLLQVYRATIRSVLDYGCEVIELGCKQIADTYDKLQYQALKICCGGMKGTSALSLQVECGELPLDLRREKPMANHALSSIAIKNESVKTKYFISDCRKSWESWCMSKSRHYQGTDRPLDTSVYQGCKKCRGAQHHPTVANQMGLWPVSLEASSRRKISFSGGFAKIRLI